MGSNLLALGIAASMWATPIMPPHYNPPIYDIPLSAELQNYTWRQCQKYKVNYELVLAIMKCESDYRPDLISRTNDYGLMQINKCNHAKFEKELGISDWLDARQNISAGVYLLGLLAARWHDPHHLLMAYNYGEGGAKKHIANGEDDSYYSRKVMRARGELEQV